MENNSGIKLTLDPSEELSLEPAQAEAIAEQKPVEPIEVTLSPEEQATALEFAKKIDVTDTNMVLQYGAAAQKKIAGFSESAWKT